MPTDQSKCYVKFYMILCFLQVVEGGELDVNFMVTSPTGRVLISEMRKTDGEHTYE